MRILAIDLGKFKSEVCMFATGTGEIRFQRIGSDRLYVERVLEIERPDVVVFEACTMTGWVYDLCQELGLRAKVANTSSEARKFKNLKRKTDRDDAERLARLEAMGELPEVRMPPASVRERRKISKEKYQRKYQRGNTKVGRESFLIDNLPLPRRPRKDSRPL